MVVSSAGLGRVSGRAGVRLSEAALCRACAGAMGGVVGAASNREECRAHTPHSPPLAAAMGGHGGLNIIPQKTWNGETAVRGRGAAAPGAPACAHPPPPLNQFMAGNSASAWSGTKPRRPRPRRSSRNGKER